MTKAEINRLRNLLSKRNLTNDESQELQDFKSQFGDEKIVYILMVNK